MPAVGAPIGNNNPGNGKRWSNAVQRAMEAYPNPPVSLEINKGLDAAAHKFVQRMMTDGDLGYFKEFGDRIDGKAPQAIIGGGENDPPINSKLTVEYIGASATPPKA